MDIQLIYSIYLPIITIITLISYGFDKIKAKSKKQIRRTPEALLLGLSLIGGGLGGFIGMLLFRHKTKHWYFLVVNIFAIILHAVIAFYIFQPKLF